MTEQSKIVLPIEEGQNQDGTTYLAVVGKTLLIATMVGGVYVYYQVKDMTRDEIYLRAVGKLLSTEWGVSLGKYLLEQYRSSKDAPEPEPQTEPGYWNRMTNYFHKKEEVKEFIEPVNAPLERQESFLGKISAVFSGMASGLTSKEEIKVLKVDPNAQPTPRPGNNRPVLPAKLNRAESCQMSHVDVLKPALKETSEKTMRFKPRKGSTSSRGRVKATSEKTMRLKPKTGKHAKWGSGSSLLERKETADSFSANSLSHKGSVSSKRSSTSRKSKDPKRVALMDSIRKEASSRSESRRSKRKASAPKETPKRQSSCATQ